MKVLVLLCVVALALADDDISYRTYGRGHDDWRYKPYGRPSPFYYHYNIKYPYWGARQGKWERSDGYRTRGSYYVNEPNSDIFVEYNFPQRDDYAW